MNKERQRRKDKILRKLRPYNYLIVSEGKETEPNYFNGIRRIIKEKYGTIVDVRCPKLNVRRNRIKHWKFSWICKKISKSIKQYLWTSLGYIW